MKPNEQKREDVLLAVQTFLVSSEYDALRINSNKIAFPCLNANGDEMNIEITISVPRGSRDGEEYDVYALNKDFLFKVEQKKKLAEETKAKKAKKVAKDKKAREKKAE